MRNQIIIQKLQVPFNSLVCKYDYYIEGQSTIILQNIQVKDTLFISDNFILIECVNKYISLFIYNIKNQELKFILDKVKSFSLLPDKRFVVACNDNCVKLYDMEICQKEINLPIYEVLSFEDKVILRGQGLFIWDLKDNIIPLEDNYQSNSANLFEKDKLITVYKHQMKIWNLHTLVCEAVLIGHKYIITNLVVSNQSIVSTSLDGQIRIWRDRVCCKVIQDFDNLQNIIIIGDKIIIREFNNVILKILSVNDGSFLGTLKVHLKYINIIQSLPNNQLIIGHYSSYEIWDLDSLQCIKTFGDNSRYFSLIISFIYPLYFEGQNILLSNDGGEGLVMWR